MLFRISALFSNSPGYFEYVPNPGIGRVQKDIQHPSAILVRGFAQNAKKVLAGWNPHPVHDVRLLSVIQQDLKVHNVRRVGLSRCIERKEDDRDY